MNRPTEFPWANDRPCAECGEVFRPRGDESYCPDCEEAWAMESAEVEG